MKRLAVKLLSCFIPVSEWRKKFRSYFLTDAKEAAIYNRLLNLENAVSLQLPEKPLPNSQYSIGIVTYNKRFHQFFKPLLTQIRKGFQGNIIVCINGIYKENFDQNYRHEMLNFLSGFENVYPVFFPEFRGLSKLWNTCLINSPDESILLLNDDVSIQDNFWNELNAAIRQNRGQSFKINKSWSHLYLNRKEVADCGWFDERLLSIGWEDNDFEARYYLKFGKTFPHIIGFTGINNLSDPYNVLKNQKITEWKYSLFNQTFFRRKFDFCKKNQNYKQEINDQTQYPYETFYWENKYEI